MATARLSSKSQIVIPAAIRRRLGLSPGDLLEIRQEGDRIVVQKVRGSALAALERLSGPIWQGSAEALDRARDEWDR